MKAYLINSLKIGKTTHRASTEDKPVVIDLDGKEFKRLETMGAVRTPTENELKLAAPTIDLEANDAETDPPKKLTKAQQKKLDDDAAAAALAASTSTETNGNDAGGEGNGAGGDDNLDV